LPVDGFPDAFVSAPRGATSPRPVVVAAHGLWDPAEGLCDDQRWIFGDHAWVVCPRGARRPDGTFHYDSADALAREIDADLHALESRFPGYVDDHAVLYTGFSQGANLGVSIVARDPARFPRAVLIEGGEGGWTQQAARQYALGGGKRVVFACGLRLRLAGARRAASALLRAGVEADVFLAKLPHKEEFIHWYNGPVADETRARLAWLFEGDGRWTF
jgi:pimeloyl-ACP methyl ester carboxylesterase